MNKPRHTKLLVCALLFLGACRAGDRERAAETVCRTVDSLLREGDVLLRRGEGVVSRAVLWADPAGVYSHAGIAVRGAEGWEVVHAVPGEPDFKGDPDRVKRDPLRVFLAAERAVRGAVMRIDDPDAAAKAARRAVEIADRGVLFDHDYDLDDTTRMYCTELIRHVFAHEGIDLAARISHVTLPGLGGDYLLPGDLQQSPHLESIHIF